MKKFQIGQKVTYAKGIGGAYDQTGKTLIASPGEEGEVIGLGRKWRGKVTYQVQFSRGQVTVLESALNS